MAETFFDNPPALAGDERNQLVQLFRYLSEMSEKLNTALNNISVEQMDTTAQQQIRTAGAEENQAAYNGLKSLIVKTAEIVHGEMDEISTVLQSQFNVVSEQFGELQRSTTASITAAADGIRQNYEMIEQLKNSGNTTDIFMNRIKGYIYTGIIDEQTGTLGIAIGEEITNQDGTMNSAKKMATFTMNKLSFWQGETELAYFTDNVFHITHGEIMKTLKIGNHTWTALTDGSLGLISG